jgi:hypothetical protein
MHINPYVSERKVEGVNNDTLDAGISFTENEYSLKCDEI